MNKHTKQVTVGIGAALAAVVLGGALLLPNAAGAVQAPEEDPAPAVATLPDVIYDQQDVTTDDGGRAILRFDQGRNVKTCLSAAAKYVGIAPARNLSDPNNGPVTWQAVEHTDCTTKIRIFNDANEPIGDASLRLVYTASAVNVLNGEVGTPPPPLELDSADVLAVFLKGLSEEAQAALVADLDCSSFATPSIAQAVFVATGGNDGPLDGLDTDDDGEACEGQPQPTPSP